MREMKDSGIEWIGEIPKEWETTKMKYIGKYINGYAFKPSDWTSKGKPIIRIQDLTGSNDNPNYYEGEIDSKYSITKGDILVSWAATLDAYIWNKNDGLLNQHIFKAIPNEIIEKSFFFWLIKEAMTNMNNDNKHGIVMQHVTLDVFNNFGIPLPPLEEQQKISAYLNDKCTKIDSIIEKQEKVIEKLKDYKLSVITEAVTKGLNPDVKMKDSGVEFLGEVPENWEVIKFGRCITIKSNLVPPENYYDYPQIAPDSIEKNSARLLDYKTVMESGVISWNHLFFKGQIIYSKIRPLLNKVIIAPFDGLCSADMYPIETKNNSKFIVYVILSNYFSAQVGLLTENRVKMPKINQNELSGIIVAIPKLEEQQQIADYLDIKCSAIDKSIEQKQAIIEKLKEYKKSLIYEVVTGKREV